METRHPRPRDLKIMKVVGVFVTAIATLGAVITAPSAAASTQPAAVAATPSTGSLPLHRSSPASPMPPLPKNIDPSQVKVLYNMATGMCMDIPGFDGGRKGGPILQYHCRPEDGDNQQVILSIDPKTAGAPVKKGMMRNRKSSLCLGVLRASGGGYDPVVREVVCSTRKDQRTWRLEPIPDTETLAIVHNATNLCLGVEGHRSKQPDTPLRLEPCDRNNDQAWTLPTATAATHWSNPDDPRNNYQAIVQEIADQMVWNCIIMGLVADQYDRSILGKVPGGRYISRSGEMSLFATSVRPGGPWDFKGPFATKYFSQGGFRSPIPGTQEQIYYDVWSNIHYAFVGRCIGLSEKDLQFPNSIDAPFDVSDPGDIATVALGVRLYEATRSKAQGVTVETMLDTAVRAALPELRAKDKTRPL